MSNAPQKDEWVTLDPHEVLSADKKGVYLFGEPISEIELTNLKQEVQALRNFRIWRIMQETLKERAIRDGFVDSVNWERTLSGKMMLHSLGIIKSVSDVILTYTHPNVQKPVAPVKRGSIRT